MVLSTVSLLCLLAAEVSYTVSYDTTYDNSGQSLDTVSCSDGPNGILSRYPSLSTFGSLPDFPYIGGAAAVAGWNSPQCGTCWQLTYNEKTITVLAIDHAEEGFNISLEAMNALTDNQAEFLGRVDATVNQVDVSQCGL
ncbi:Cerato-platanin [Gloeophyllum trabeum ATCC 11539]|uniref:Cerato-platanin n=1 Tax=Gloeophyllum trabeum (strain ATCC 11539 / FP-39264 / Madison 617) TaxID=670483 RepID=S7RT07_GLOTA|nr:Cerato-platanin [Gloeophyllum trabeum ATCC 11539]EPQ57820.1 Cerato-platanin [Gloeophyllum trabeum ATCC 11539]